MERVDVGFIIVEVTLGAPDLFVAAEVMDITPGQPAAPIPAVAGMVNGLLPMTNLMGNSYYALPFPTVDGHYYAVNKAVYTDDTYTELKPYQPQGSDTYQAVLGGGGGGGSTDVVLVGTQIRGVIAEVPHIVAVVEELPGIEGC